jgi:hypothetical protein
VDDTAAAGADYSAPEVDDDAVSGSVPGEGESIISGLFPEGFEEFDRLAMGEDVQEA